LFLGDTIMSKQRQKPIPKIDPEKGTAEFRFYHCNGSFSLGELIRMARKVNPDINPDEVIITPCIVFEMTAKIKISRPA